MNRKSNGTESKPYISLIIMGIQQMIKVALVEKTQIYCVKAIYTEANSA